MRLWRNNDADSFLRRSTQTVVRNMTKRLTQAKAFRQLIEAWEAVLLEAFGMTDAKARSVVRAFLGKREVLDEADATAAVVRALLGAQIKRGVRRQAKTIKTEEQLAKEIERVRQFSETFPTLIRKALKDFTSMLPRRGGPGRKPKLTSARASAACDQISIAMRQGDSLKAALIRVSAASVSLWGIKVGTRTLQKAWDKRAKQ